uniref:Uncharacterized protein n=1 Tax=Tanacetum cinerariifolium TaxID=118510 RepID=A0A6L2LZ75_TANCI|nr:hypothetical protein [Tanacetum cinerariifolium]
MRQEQALQVAHDKKFVSTRDRVKIGKSNLRIDPTITEKEETYQVILDIIKNTLFYNTFRITADEDLQYQIDNVQSKVRRRDIMPYLRFTKVIVHYFMSKHKSIPRDKKERGKAAQGTKAVIIHKKATAASKKKKPKKKVSIPDKSSDEESDKEEERIIEENMGVVIQDTPQASKKKSKDPSQKLKLKGAGLGREVPDEPSKKSTNSDEGAGTSPEMRKSKAYHRNPMMMMMKKMNLMMIRILILKRLMMKGWTLMLKIRTMKKLKPDEELKGDDQARDEQLVVPVSLHKKRRPICFNPPPVISHVPSVVKEYLRSSLPNAFQKVLQSDTEELKKEPSETRDYKDVIEESVQANIINEVKNFLPKFLPLVVKEVLEKTLLFLGQSSSQGQSTSKAVGSLFKYELKKILYAKMHKSQSDLTHDIHQELYDALTWSMLLDEATTKEGDNPNKLSRKDIVEIIKIKNLQLDQTRVRRPKKRRFNESESSKKTSNTKESSKASDDVEQPFDDKVGDVSQPPHTDVSETQTDAAPRILKKDWFKNAPRPETLDSNWNIVKIVDDAPEHSWLNERIKAQKPYSRHKSPVDMSKPLPLRHKEGRLTILVEFFINNDLEHLKARNKERSYSSFITKTSAERYTMEGTKDMILTIWSLVIITHDNDAALGISH